MTPLYRIIHGIGSWIDGLYARGLQLRPTCGDPEAEALAQSVGSADPADWEAARTILRKEPRAWGRRFFLVDVASGRDHQPTWLEDLTREHPDDAEAQLVAGAAWMHLAWKARGSGYAQTVSEAGARLFFERLHLGRLSLMRATKLAPADPTPWAFLIRVGRGLNAEMEVLEQYFTAAVAADPQHHEAHHEMLQSKCAKWSGSNEEMWAFAREAEAAAAQGSPVCSVIPIAHMENALSVADDDHVADPRKAVRDYWSQPHVAKSITNAYRKMQCAGAPLSPDRLSAISDFAYGLWQCGAREHAREAFEQIGERLTGHAWRVHFLEARTFRKARRECGA